MQKSKQKIGIIGSGRLGTALARAVSNAGYEVAIINSKGVDSLQLQLSILLPKVVAMEIHELITWADVIILAVPLRSYTSLPLHMMSGKIVIDAMNYWAPIDGTIPEFEAYAGSSSELVAASIGAADIVKTFNSVAYNELEEHASFTDTTKRRAIPIAGNDTSTKEIVTTMINDIGFDAVDMGNLKNGRLFQPDTQLFNTRLTKNEMLRTIK